MLHTDGGRCATERLLIREESNSISAVRERGLVTATQENLWPRLGSVPFRPPQGSYRKRICLSYAAANLSQPCICATMATSIPKIPRHLPKGRRARRESHKLFNPTYSRDQSIARNGPGCLFHIGGGVRKEGVWQRGQMPFSISACSEDSPVLTPHSPCPPTVLVYFWTAFSMGYPSHQNHPPLLYPNPFVCTNEWTANKRDNPVLILLFCMCAVERRGKFNGAKDF